LRDNKIVTEARSRFLPLLGVLIALVLTFALNQWLYDQARLVRITSGYARLYVLEIISGLFLIIVWLALAWITLVRSQRSALVSIIFLALGFFIYCYQYIWILGIWSWLPLLFKSFDTPLSYTGIFIAVLGGLHFLLPASSSAKS
jgi:hypothetical protein